MTFRGLLYYEVSRELRKKSFIVLISLALLPVLVAAALEATDAVPEIKNPRAWAFILGFVEGPSAAMGVGLSGLAAWAWLVAILYGGDLLAADVRDGVMQLILVRPVSRKAYVASKLASVTITLTLLFVVAGLSSVAAAWILFGPQEAITEATAFSALLGLSCLPLLLASALLGLITGSPVQGMVLGFAVYMVSLIVPGVVAAAIEPPTPTSIVNYVRLVAVLYGYVPFVASFELPGLLYSLLYEEPWAAQILGGLEPGELLPIYLASTLTSTTALILLLHVVLTKRDL
jgi:ABC-type transport system involved in multi-copper enzyme maturation permease subunit